MSDVELPGSQGEHEMQEDFGTVSQAKSFYDSQMREFLAPRMQEFIKAQEMVFISTSDKNGECDCSIRMGEAGFVRVIDEKHLAYADYKGNGVMASAGNISENPHIGLLFVDFFHDKVGLHVNGKATIVDNDTMRTMLNEAIPDESKEKKCQFWTLIEVEESYIHCSKNIPIFQKQEKPKQKHYPIDYFELQDQ